MVVTFHIKAFQKEIKPRCNNLGNMWDFIENSSWHKKRQIRLIVSMREKSRSQFVSKQNQRDLILKFHFLVLYCTRTSFYIFSCFIKYLSIDNTFLSQNTLLELKYFQMKNPLGLKCLWFFLFLRKFHVNRSTTFSLKLINPPKSQYLFVKTILRYVMSRFYNFFYEICKYFI